MISKAHARKLKKYQRPFLKLHIAGLVVAGWLLFSGAILVSFGVQQKNIGPHVLSIKNEAVSSSVKTIRMSGGFTFAYDSSALDLMIKDSNNEYTRSFSLNDESIDLGLRDIIIKPSQENSSGELAATQLEINLDDYSELSSDHSLRIARNLQSEHEETINNITFNKRIYRNVVNIGNKDFVNYSIVWLGRTERHPIRMILGGLPAPSTPLAYQVILSSVELDKSHVLGFSSTSRGTDISVEGHTLNGRYVADMVSPAVVKIYNITCGIIVVDEREVSKNTCNLSTGSGFFISSQGHIATNGHVVTYDAEDALVNALTKNPHNLPRFLRYLGFNDAQIEASTKKPELLAAAIAKIYEKPDDAVRFKDLKFVVLVSLGTKPLIVNNESEARKAIDHEDDEFIKRAQIVATNYSAKDLLIIESDNPAGFSASDVGILKIDSVDTPYIDLLDGHVIQNQTISIIGFPGDADNQLTDNSVISPTITNGTISAIRFAAGSSHKLYQSDADASRGSSGGPVIDEEGKALGILTYRFKSDRDIDAAKSYIRDIKDIKALAQKNEVELGDSGGIVQSKWLSGLSYYSSSRFSKALSSFEEVKEAYPAHRLAGQYIYASQQAIDEGRDIKDFPMMAALGMSVTGALFGGWIILLIIKHHSRHVGYKIANRANVLISNSHNKFQGRHAHT